MGKTVSLAINWETNLTQGYKLEDLKGLKGFKSNVNGSEIYLLRSSSASKSKTQPS